MLYEVITRTSPPAPARRYGPTTSAATAPIRTSITPVPVSFTSYNVTYYRNDTFDLTINTTNTGNTTAFNAYINISKVLSYNFV